VVYFGADMVPFVAKGGPVLMAKGGILLVAEIGILYLTIYSVVNYRKNETITQLFTEFYAYYDNDTVGRVLRLIPIFEEEELMPYEMPAAEPYSFAVGQRARDSSTYQYEKRYDVGNAEEDFYCQA